MKTLSIEKMEGFQGGDQDPMIQKFCSAAAAIALFEPTPLGEAAVLACLVHCVFYC